MNESYYRFRNTLQSLKNCADHIRDSELLSEEEEKAQRKLIELCKEISDNYY